MIVINVSDNDNIRLDKYLIDSLEISRTKIQNLIKEEKIRVNNELVKASYIVKLDDEILIEDLVVEKNEIKAENISLDIVYEDDDLMVINKPSGMVVHPAVGNYSHTLVNALMYHCKNLSSVNGEVRPGIVHRLDADTSGLLLVAKNDETHLYLSELLQKREINRYYVALVHGVIYEDSATIDAPIGRDPKDRKKMAVTAQNSKEAITDLKVLERYDNATLIECKLRTGRTHQIRVHLDYIKHPVVNDNVYGTRKVIKKEFGQMLHAKTLGFVHPKTLKYLEFTVEPPQEFMDILSIYKKNS